MRRIQFLLLGALVATSFAGCKDDEGDPKPTPVDCSKPENADHKDCKVEEKECKDTLTIPAEGAKDLCANEADRAAYAAAKAEITGEASKAAIACDGMEAETDAEITAVGICTSCALAEQFKLSPECASCVGRTVACVVAHCALDCAGDAESTECLDCRETNKCDEGADECTGLGAPATVDCEDEANADHADCKVDCEDEANADHADCQDPA